MITVRMILLILACISLFLAAINVSSPRINLIALGLALWVLAVIVTAP